MSIITQQKLTTDLEWAIVNNSAPLVVCWINNNTTSIIYERLSTFPLPSWLAVLFIRSMKSIQWKLIIGEKINTYVYSNNITRTQLYTFSNWINFPAAIEKLYNYLIQFPVQYNIQSSTISISSRIMSAVNLSLMIRRTSVMRIPSCDHKHWNFYNSCITFAFVSDVFSINS